ncbi:uncharacterized protein LOC121976185 [Zingiber officinale]|uniref:RBR-type E3 ubiquitin transferase n=1 Tax=Zingiber officinale TaxID=94328 RepID=A0A8J5LBA0_ZINOF|nr:uncharacterized protein LOC121976185 [Zingiber officinale]KAG6511889.1 hypothetical protein ZIOFF_029968 [Zingiber officinale]
MSEPDDLDLVLSQQRCELMAATFAESDLDLAFRLQMEEAMAASLAGPPSNGLSSSTAATAAASSSSFPPIVADSDRGGFSDAIMFQYLEVERLQDEVRDFERSRAVARRMTDDIRRRAHDERVARDIDEMPEDEWEEFGDHFERPIENVQAVEEPTFRLYFKGMVSEHLSNGRLVHLAAIAAAVCDPSGNLLLKIQKPVPIKDVGTCREVVETAALIEGLNAVISLGIKNISVFCDYKVLYNHVRGIWVPKRTKVAQVVNQVKQLRINFKKFTISFLPRWSVKFVFTFARDAINSQLSKDVVDAVDPKFSRETCIICLEVTNSSDMLIVDNCLHRFCFSCMKQHVEAKLHHGILPGCPHDGCKVILDLESGRKYLPPKLLELLSQRLKEASIPDEQKVYCPYPRCSALMSASDVKFPRLEELSKSSDKSVVDYLRKCIKCNGSFCINCKVPWHEKLTCYQFKMLSPTILPEEARLQALAKQKLWRQCVKCNHMIELSEGCFHMTCRCGYEFCYTCGVEWVDKKQACNCPLFEYETEDESEIYEEDEDYSDEDSYYDSNYGDYGEATVDFFMHLT